MPPDIGHARSAQVGRLQGVPFVSVVIPAYDAAPTIRRAITSVLDQAYPNLEIIVVDDASTDATAEIVEAMNVPEVRLVRLARNIGECGAMNAGIAQARGSYVAFLDADDAWLPTKLAKQIAALERNPKASFAACGCHFIYADGHPDTSFGMPPPGLDKAQAWRCLLARSFVAKPCVVARASSLALAGPFDSSLVIAGDQDMWIRLALIGEIEIVEEYLTVVHDTPGSLTKVHARRASDYVLPMIDRHVETVKSFLTPAELRRILGERYTFLGRDLYASGNSLRGAHVLLRAIAAGSRVGENAWYLVAASPLARMVRRWTRPAGRK
jgi:glycosyltransferase involved in cell wall biosynthesis